MSMFVNCSALLVTVVVEEDSVASIPPIIAVGFLPGLFSPLSIIYVLFRLRLVTLAIFLLAYF